MILHPSLSKNTKIKWILYWYLTFANRIEEWYRIPIYKILSQHSRCIYFCEIITIIKIICGLPVSVDHKLLLIWHLEAFQSITPLKYKPLLEICTIKVELKVSDLKNKLTAAKNDSIIKICYIMTSRRQRHHIYYSFIMITFF